METISTNAPEQVPFHKKLFQIVVPQIPKFEIPKDTQQVIFGIPGFLCTKAALKPGIDELNQDGIAYIDWGNAVDFGFTNRIVKHVADYTDAIAQQFGGQISVHGNSLGGFLAYFAAYSNPAEVKRLILTASPHLLTLDPTHLSEHTNIAPFIGLMNSSLLARFMSKDTISLWARMRAGDLADDIETFWNQIEQIELLTFAASKDTTVRGRMCLTAATSEFLERLKADPTKPALRPPNKPNVREFAVPGDHVDVFRGSVKTIRYLASRDLQTSLPDEIQKTLVPLESIEELERRAPHNVAWDFTKSSIPTIDLGKTISKAVNVPASLLRRFNPPAKPVGLEFGRIGLSASNN